MKKMLGIILMGVTISQLTFAAQFVVGDKVLDLKNRVFSKVIEIDHSGMTIQNLSGIDSMSFVRRDSFEVGALSGCLSQQVCVGSLVFDKFKQQDALVVAISGDNKASIQHLNGALAGKILIGYDKSYLAVQQNEEPNLKLTPQLSLKKKSSTTEVNSLRTSDSSKKMQRQEVKPQTVSVPKAIKKIEKSQATEAKPTRKIEIKTGQHSKKTAVFKLLLNQD